MITQRTATSADISSLWDLRTRAVRETCASHYTDELLAAWVAAPMPSSMPRMVEAGWALVAEDEGGLIGYAMVDLELGEVDAVFVERAHQGRGVGRRLLRALEEMAGAQGFGRVFLTASLNAVPFYRSAGYEPVHDEPYSHRSGLKIPAVCMEKRLARG